MKQKRNLSENSKYHARVQIISSSGFRSKTVEAVLFREFVDTKKRLSLKVVTLFPGITVEARSTILPLSYFDSSDRDK